MLREHIKNRNSQLQSKVKTKKIITREPHRTNKSFVFISKDKMARLMALLLGVPAQDFLRDAFDENRVLSEQVHYFPNAFWENQKEVLKQKDEEGREQKQIRVFVARAFRNILVNEFVVIRGSATSPDKHFRVIDKKSPEVVHLRELVDYMKPKNALLGIRALNHGQNRALDVLLDPDVRVVILHGSFGTSKTFMALLAGYYQMIQHNAYRKIVVTRVPVGIGRKKLEAIPGGVNEKMSPYMQGVKSNTHILASYFTQSIFPQAFKKEPPPIEILKQRIASKKNKIKKEEKEKNFEACYNVVFGWMNEVRSVEHPSTILGMSFFDEFVLYEEVQDNITEEFKSFLTRLGKGDMFGDARPKIVLTGSLQQMGEEIDDGNSVFARLIAKSVGQKGLAQVLLTECTRDPLVHVFNEIL
jgi:predicted ribonuclease YlaK